MKEILQSNLNQLKEAALAAFASAIDEASLYNAKVEFLGKKGKITDILKNLGTLSVEERPVIGALANQVRNELDVEYDSRLNFLKNSQVNAALAKETIDVTLPGIASLPVGHIHPLTHVLEEMKTLFREMGFDIHNGPEMETDYYNFEALNIPKNHPARDMQDTFYLKKVGEKAPLLLRTHTSPVQVRVMEKQRPPIAMVAPGVVYRRDSDVSHTPMFHQIEGLLVDEGIHFGHLKGVIEHFLKKLFSPDTAVRFRPSYFPFTEPSAEVDIGCVFCSGSGKNTEGNCRICKGTGWLEIMGCGMVDPEVFASVKIDSEKYTGFAFGVGIERVTMLKYGINDLRLFFENDFRFLKQF